MQIGQVLCKGINIFILYSFVSNEDSCGKKSYSKKNSENKKNMF